MGCFLGLIYELPKISFNVFDIKLVINAIKEVCNKNYFDKMFSGDIDNIKSTNINKDLCDDSLILKQDKGLDGKKELLGDKKPERRESSDS
jgi:hypothetical protein